MLNVAIAIADATDATDDGGNLISLHQDDPLHSVIALFGPHQRTFRAMAH